MRESSRPPAHNASTHGAPHCRVRIRAETAWIETRPEIDSVPWRVPVFVFSRPPFAILAALCIATLLVTIDPLGSWSRCCAFAAKDPKTSPIEDRTHDNHPDPLLALHVADGRTATAELPHARARGSDRLREPARPPRDANLHPLSGAPRGARAICVPSL
jgi:hypothetical protein